MPRWCKHLISECFLVAGAQTREIPIQSLVVMHLLPIAQGHPKGRDYYDLLWYLTSEDWPGPNMLMLRNALRQTGWSKEDLESLNLRLLLEEKFRSVDWAAIRRDIEPFLENPAEVEYLNAQDMLRLLSGSVLF